MTVAGRSVEAAEVGSCSVVAAAADPDVAAVVPASQFPYADSLEGEIEARVPAADLQGERDVVLVADAFYTLRYSVPTHHNAQASVDYCG